MRRAMCILFLGIIPLFLMKSTVMAANKSASLSDKKNGGCALAGPLMQKCFELGKNNHCGTVQESIGEIAKKNSMSYTDADALIKSCYTACRRYKEESSWSAYKRKLCSSELGQMAADFVSSPKKDRVPLAIKQEDDHERPIPITLNTSIDEEQEQSGSLGAAKSHCLTPCGLFVSPGALSMSIGGFDSGLVRNTAMVQVPREGLGIVLSSPGRSHTGVGVTMIVFGSLALTIGPLVMLAKPDVVGLSSGGVTTGLGLLALLIPGIVLTKSNKSEIVRTFPLASQKSNDD